MRMTEGFAFFPLTFDESGELLSPDELDAMIARAKTSPKATDAIVLAHGFRNDVNDATMLYDEFLKTFAANIARPEFKSVATRRFLVAGVYWPSKPFKETYIETGGTRALKDPSRAMAGVKAQLEDFKSDATPAKRKKLDKAIKLLPKLDGNLKAQDEFVDARAVAGRQISRRCDRGAAEGPPAIGIGAPGATGRRRAVRHPRPG